MVDGQTDVGMKMSRNVKIYLACLGAGGLVLILLNVLLSIGTWTYIVAGFMLIAGPGSLLANHFQVGWQPAVGPCPQCGMRLHYVTKKMYMRCAGCQAFLMVQEKQLHPVDPQSTSPKPEFPLPYVQQAAFPNLCMFCLQSAENSELVKFEHVENKGGIPGIVSVHEVQKMKVEVPVCKEHIKKKVVSLDYGDHHTTSNPDTGVSLKFRSLAAMEAYRQHNADLMPALLNEPSMPHAPEAAQPNS